MALLIKEYSQLWDYLTICAKNRRISIVYDFAIKFKIKKFIEPQKEFFCKRGLVWHVTVLAFNVNNTLQTLSIVHCFTNVPQDSDCVFGIVDNVFSFKNSQFHNPTIDLVSDNAACYHCQEIICFLPLIAAKRKVFLESYHFSEPQMGKGIADRKISLMKSAINQHVNEDNNVTSIE